MTEQPGWLPSPNTGLAEVLDALAEAVTIRDSDHRIIYANRAALDHMGFSTLEEIQRTPPQSILEDYVVHDESGREVTMEDIPSVRLLAGLEASPLLIRTVHRATGEMGWQVLKATLMRDEHGDPLATVTIIEDVTTEKLVEQRERFLARATDTLMSSIDYEETLRNIAWLAVPEIADWCAVDLLDEDGRRQHVVVAHADAQKLGLAERLRRFEPRQETATERIARTGVTELYNDISEEMLSQSAINDEHRELLLAVGFRSVLIVPLTARGRTLGVMTLVNSDSLRRFEESDKEFAEGLAARAAIAVDNARLATSRRDIAITLQCSLLPDAVPAIEGWEVATMYRAASDSDEVAVGGDFYDFIRSPAGWIVLLGDVTGRGVRAAAMTSLVRHGARFLGRDEECPSAILTRLDEALRDQPVLSLCTALCVRLAPDHIVLSSAGHPPPLVVSDDGEVRELHGTGPLLGGWAESSWEDHTVAVGPEETLLLFTDGVTDTRGERERFGAARLRELLTRHAGESPQGLLHRLEEALEHFEVSGRSDDTGAVALRALPTGRPPGDLEAVGRRSGPA